MRGGHAKNNKIKEREGPLVYQCICGSIMRKATFEWVTKQKKPSENNCSRGFFRIFVDLLLVERNHSLTLKGAKLISSNLVIVVLLA